MTAQSFSLNHVSVNAMMSWLNSLIKSRMKIKFALTERAFINEIVGWYNLVDTFSQADCGSEDLFLISLI